MATTTITPIPTATFMDSGALFRLLAWTSPNFPVGAFSYSHGIEYAVECGAVSDAATLGDWIATIVELGSGRSDAILFCAAWRAAATNDGAVLRDVAERAAALRGSAELGLETTAQGRAFTETQAAAWPAPGMPVISGWNGPVAYPIAVAIACAAHGIPLDVALPAYLHGFASNLTSAGVRLVPLGQMQGQRVLAALEGALGRTAAEAIVAPLSDAGSAAWMADWTSMLHETQRTRLFRS